MVLTARGRAAYGVVCATLLTVALLGLMENRADHDPPSAAGEGTLVISPRPSSPSADRATPRPLTRTSPGSSKPPAPSPGTAVSGSGRLAVVPGDGAVHGNGPLRRYSVMVEMGLGEDPAAFADEVERTLADPRAWGAHGRGSFQRVAAGAVYLTIVLASPTTTDRLCRPLDTAGIYSCFNNGRAVINVLRWRAGAPAYARDLASYRHYVVLHEVGHALGHRHEPCPRPGRLAPTMMQQTKGVSACRANPWPFPEEG